MRLFPSADQAMRRLMLGNERFVTGQVEHRHQSADRRVDLLEGQEPFAVVLGCSDSRVPPEVIFDYGLGDLFVIRVAGNVVDKVVLASIEYAASMLQTRLVIVLGHGRCGAVTAASKGVALPGHLPAVLDAIAPSVWQARAEAAGDTEDIIDAATRINACTMARQIVDQSSIVARLVRSGLLKVTPATTDLLTGRVTLHDR